MTYINLTWSLLEVGRRVGRGEPVGPVMCAKSRGTRLGRAGQESAERTTITLE